MQRSASGEKRTHGTDSDLALTGVYASLIEAKVLTRQLDAALAEVNLSLNTLVMLEQLVRGPMIQRMVADSLGVDKVAISRWVTMLCEAGYISRTNPDDDKRRCVLEITPAGMHVLSRGKELAVEHLEGVKISVSM